LNDHFRKERKLRINLKQRDSELVQRTREVTALNRLLQEHLLEWYKVAEDYREVLVAIKETLRSKTFGENAAELEAMLDNVVNESEAVGFPLIED
jgi:hypothetical protein